MQSNNKITSAENILSLISSQNLGPALAAAVNLCKEKPESSEAWCLLSIVNLQMNEPSKSILNCQKALSIEPKNYQALTVLGRMYHQLGQHTKAINNFKTAINIAHDCVDAFYYLSVLLIEISQFERAVENLKHVVQLMPANSQSWFLMGACYGQLGNLAEAVKCCKKVVVLQPDHLDAHFNLGQAFMLKNEYQNAIQAYSEVLRINPTHITSLDNMGHAYKSIGRFNQSVDCFFKGVELEPDNIDLLIKLGNSLHDAKRYDEAKIYYEKALKIQPDLEEVKFVLSALSEESLPEKPPANYVSGLFDDYADKFDESLVGKLNYRTPELLYNLITANKSASDMLQLDVLDLGCGTGLCGPLLRKHAKRMVGIDLSEKMIAKAREKAIYDELKVGDITEPEFALSLGVFDLLIAADVFPYIGDLADIFKVCSMALRKEGIFAFSAEASEDGDTYELRSTNRYAHSLSYLKTITKTSGFELIDVSESVLRKDRGKPVNGYLFLVKI